MKSTGIVRRIDDLGRVVIPKEIRRTMKIDTGDPLKIYINPYEGKVVFKKYYLCSCSSEQESIIKFAEWIKTDYKPYLYCKCSLCGHREKIIDKSNYCPNCGAIMCGG